jgi:hypothetical protein
MAEFLLKKDSFYKMESPNFDDSDVLFMDQDGHINLPDEMNLVEVEEPEGFFVSKEIKEYRKAICDGCPKKKLNLCTLCGCFLPAKQIVSSFSCPEDRW